MTKIAIIGGTGLAQISGLKAITTKTINTPFGIPSADYISGIMYGEKVIFLARHGNPPSIPPHKINYRANLWGLKELGVTDIIASAAVGGIIPSMYPSHIVLPDQIIDYSYGREHTFFADNLDALTHIDFTIPYSTKLRVSLILAAKKANLAISPTATYACTQGPRLESTAEIKRLEADGCHIVGMTAMPEAALAKELNLNYAAIAVVANWAAGKTKTEITRSKIEYHLTQGMNNVAILLQLFFFGLAS